MDFATIIGILSGLALLGVSVFSGTGASVFFDPSSIIMVVGGTLAATFINFPITQVLKVFGVIAKAFMNTTPVLQNLTVQIVELSKIARREGILAIEERLNHDVDPFLRKGMQLAVDGVDPDLIEGILAAEIEAQEERHEQGQKIMKAMGTYSPAFGMIGTLIGLIRMLQSLEDPTQIGAGMALALVTTFYGAILANLLFLPIAGKLETLTASEKAMRTMIMYGVLSIQSGDNPRIVEEKLKTFIPPKLRNFDAVRMQ